MPWQDSSHARASGPEVARDRMPRAIAARLKRAGLLRPATVEPVGRPDERASSSGDCAPIAKPGSDALP